jgi:hypothetical protein
MNENPGLNPNTDDFTPRKADDAWRIIVFESVAMSDGHHNSWPSLISQSRIASRIAQYYVPRQLTARRGSHRPHVVGANILAPSTEFNI